MRWPDSEEVMIAVSLTLLFGLLVFVVAVIATIVITTI